MRYREEVAVLHVKFLLGDEIRRENASVAVLAATTEIGIRRGEYRTGV